MPLRGTSQVACPTSKRTSPRRIGRSARQQAGEPPASAECGGFCMSTLTSRLWWLLPLAAIAAAAVSLAGGAAAGAPQFPLTLTAANGKVTILRRPSRIVSLSPTATDDLFAVGAGKQVVAVDSYSTYPAKAPRTKLSGFTPNVEAIAKYRPDLVVVSDDMHN